MANLSVRFVIKISPIGKVDFYRENNNTTLGQAYTQAQGELQTGDILKVVSINVTTPPDPAKPKDPPIDINITV